MARSIVPTGAGASELLSFVHQTHLAFPVLHDDASLLRALYGIERMPYSVLVDQNGAPIMVNTTPPDPEEQAKFHAALERHLEKGKKRARKSSRQAALHSGVCKIIGGYVPAY